MAEFFETAQLSGYWRLFVAQTRAQAQYRASFWTDLVASVAFGVADVIAVAVVFGAAGSLGGFSRAEGMLMVAFSSCGFAIADLAVGNIDTLRTYVRTGRLDAVLLRPLGVFGQLVATDFTPRRAGRVLLATALIPVAAHWCGVRWSPAKVLLAVVAPVSSAVLFGAVFVASATVAFWWIDSGEFGHGFTYGGRDFSAYPMTVYAGPFRWMFAYGLGYGFTGYYPALWLLDRADPLGGPGWLGWAAPGAAVVLSLVAAVFWRFGVRQYRSTGS